MKLTLAQAADKIGVHPMTLKGWDLQDPPIGPPCTRTAGGHRRYDEQDIRDWQLATAQLQHRVNEAVEDQAMAAHGAVRQRVVSGIEA